MVIFEDNDADYRAWLDANQNGLVVNAYRSPTASYLRLHSASCATISQAPAHGETWTCGGYI